MSEAAISLITVDAAGVGQSLGSEAFEAEAGGFANTFGERGVRNFALSSFGRHVVWGW